MTDLKGLVTRSTAREKRASLAGSMEIDDAMVTRHEEKPFAKGSFGLVFRITYERTVMVAKVINLEDEPVRMHEKIKEQYAAEVALMAGLRSTNIVSIYGAITTRPGELAIIMEYCEMGTLRSFLDALREEGKGLTIDDLINFIEDVASGMCYLHSKDVVHMDLKTLNVLISRHTDGSKRCKVADFGQVSTNYRTTSTEGI